MGEESCMSIAVASPVAGSQTPVADAMGTPDGPVMAKSEPFAAIEEHLTGWSRFILIDPGLQLATSVLMIVGAGAAGMVNGVEDPIITSLLQFPMRLFPSEPWFTVTV